MTPFKVCRICGQRAVLDMERCGPCGAAFPASVTQGQPVYCVNPACRRQLPPGSSVCPACRADQSRPFNASTSLPQTQEVSNRDALRGLLVLVGIVVILVLSFMGHKRSPGTTAEHRQSFTRSLEMLGAGSYVSSVEEGGNDDEVKIVVTNAWHYEPFQTRLQLAQALWKMW